MKVLVVVLLVITLASADDKVAETHVKNRTMFEESNIIGGVRTNILHVSSNLAILDEGSLLCSANLIKSKVALSAAHCLHRKDPKKLKVRSGSIQYSFAGIVVDVVGSKTHHKYQHCDQCYNFDLTLLFLATSALADGLHAKVITLWGSDTYFHPGTPSTTSGWGQTKEVGRLSIFLMTVTLPIVSKYTCAEKFGEPAGQFNICAGYSLGGKGGCNGDSGAGLVIEEKLAGVLSYSRGCAQPNSPAVYVSVPAFHSWIQKEAGL